VNAKEIKGREKIISTIGLGTGLGDEVPKEETRSLGLA